MTCERVDAPCGFAKDPSANGQNESSRLESGDPVLTEAKPVKKPFGSGKLFRDRFANFRPFGHPASVVDDLWKSGRIHAVLLQRLRHSEQVGIADRIHLPHHPRPPQHFTLDEIVTRRHRFRHLALHGFDGRCIVGPSISAHAVGMGDVQRRAQITVEGLRLRKREWLVERRQARLRKALRDDRLAIAWFDKNLK